MRFLELIWLKWKGLAARPLALILFCILPFVLTIPAGLVHRNNDFTNLRPVVVNLSRSPEAEQFVDWLSEGELNWRETTKQVGFQELYNGSADVLLLVPEDFSIPGRPVVRLARGSRAEAVGIVIEEAATAIVPLMVRDSMVDALAEEVQVRKQDVGGLAEKFFLAAKEETSTIPLRMTTEGVDLSGIEQNRLLWLPRYNIELLFLSLFAVLGSFSLRDRGRTQKLLSIQKAFLLDGFSRFAALAALGFGQIVLLHLGLAAVLPQIDTNAYSLFVLFSFLLTQLAAAQCFVLLHEDQRLLSSLLTLCFSSALGGCFFTLPSGFMHRIGYFSPHGWAMGALERVPLLSPFWVALLSLLVFVLALLTQALKNRL